MKSVVIEKPGVMVFKDSPIPEPPAGFARVKVKAAAVCATDLEVIDGNIPANYPLIPGHEWSGVVDAVGSEKDAHWVGERVVGSNDVVCLTCEACRRGEWRYCKSFEEIGFRRNGAYAEYVIVPAYGLVKLPASVSFRQGALAEPLGVALGTMKKSRAKMGDTCLIIGAGSIGLCTLAVAKTMGLSKIVVAATSRGRLELAEKMGAYATVATREEDLAGAMARLHPEGTDVIIDATGIEECITAALKLAKKGGTVVLEGYGRGKVMNIRIDDIHVNNLHLVGAGNNWNWHKKAIDLMDAGLINLEDFVTEVMPLEDYERAIELVRTRPKGFVKAVFEL